MGSIGSTERAARYAAVASSRGCAKTRAVSPVSTSRPSRRNATWSETRLGLREVVRDDDDDQLRPELSDQIPRSSTVGRGIERRARLVHEDHLGLGGERAGDAEALLLPAGEARAPSGADRVLTSSHSPARTSARSTGFGERRSPGPARALRTQRVGDVVEDRHGERVRPLEDHADTPAQGRRSGDA